MNYTTITINDQKIGLKFGMASFRYLSDKFANNKAIENNELNEIAIAHILYSGYYNNCLVKEVEPSLTFEDFVDFIEANIMDVDVVENIRAVVEVWSKNDFLKDTQEKTTEAKKKNSRGKK